MSQVEDLQAIPVLLPQDNTKPLGSDTMPREEPDSQFSLEGTISPMFRVLNLPSFCTEGANILIKYC